MTNYNAPRGGHAPGFLRDALYESLCWYSAEKHWYEPLAEDDSIIFRDEQMQRQWGKMSPIRRARWLIGKLWNCTDIMPRSLCDDLDLQQGSTYARGVRKLAAETTE